MATELSIHCTVLSTQKNIGSTGCRVLGTEHFCSYNSPSLRTTPLLKRIATAVVLIPIVLALILRAPVSVLTVVAAVVALVAMYEFLKLTESYGVDPMPLPTYLFAVLFFVMLGISASGETPLLSTGTFLIMLGFAAAIAPFIFLTRAMRGENLRSGYPSAAAAVFAFTYIALPLGMLVQLRQQWAGAFYLLYLLLVVWAGDIFAYFVGKSIGRHLMAPRISPKKTWEGAAASLVASVVVGWLLFLYSLPISSALLRWGLIERRDGLFGLERPQTGSVIVLTIVLNIAAQLGDLVESLIKRGAGVKDSGAILPGHGGMLDRIDALLFAAPVLWYYAAWRVMQ
jgi:phosphatidate cytidylyltransferase